MEKEHLSELNTLSDETKLKNESLDAEKDDKLSLNDNTVPESKSFLANITLEPMWFGVYISGAIDLIIYKNLFIERACLVDLNYTKDACNVFEALDPSIEIQAQAIVSSVSVNSGIIAGILSCILVIFLGPWSDSSGRRKPIMLLSAFSFILTTVVVLILLAFPTLSVAWIIYLKAILLSGANLMLMSAYSYLGDICYNTRRCATVVMGRNGLAIFLSIVTGSFFSPLLYRLIGFAWVIAISVVLQILAFIFIYFKVHDVNISETNPSIFDISLPINAFKCMFKKREGYKRAIILFMMIIPSANMIIVTNEMSLRYMFLRNILSFSETDYGTFITVRMIVNSIGIWMIVKIFKQRFKIRDEIVGLIGGISETFDATVLLNLKTTWMLYATAVFGILSSGPITVERPIINKFISQNEQGKIYSIISILEMVFTYTTVPFSNFVYSKTLADFPSCFMLITIFGSAITVLCYICIIKLCNLERQRVKDAMNEAASKIVDT